MKKVLVIGDGCLDVFRYGRCSRLSPEAPVPVFNPTNSVGNGGMVINVLENLKALGVDVDIITNDIRPVKTRFVDEVSNQMLLRVDEKDEIRHIDQNLLGDIDYQKYDAIVISDYNKGFLDIHDIMFIAAQHKLVFLDSKKELGGWCDDVEFIKVNEKEYLQSKEYLDNIYPNTLIVTLGKRGAVLKYNDYGEYCEKLIEIEEEHDVRDLSGAGDTFLAALVVDYLKNNDICNAIRFANKCASWVVTQKGVVVINPDKI